MARALGLANLLDHQVGGRRNLIINGAMQVAQRGTSSTDTSYQTVDRFHNLASTDGTITQSQTAISSGDPYNEGFRNVYRHTVTTASSSPASSHFLGVRYNFEAQDMAQSGWQYTSTSSSVTLSFWAKSNVAGTYVAGLRTNDSTPQNYTFKYTLTADTWKKVTHTFIGDSNITINNDTGVGLLLDIWLYLGGDYTTSGHTHDAWTTYSSSSQASDFAQNWMTTASATFDITGVQLELGETATPFEHRSYGEELALCQRYYEIVGMTVTTAGQFDNAVSYAVTKRATPTLSVFSGSLGTASVLAMPNNSVGQIRQQTNASNPSDVAIQANAEL